MGCELTSISINVKKKTLICLSIIELSDHTTLSSNDRIHWRRFKG